MIVYTSPSRLPPRSFLNMLPPKDIFHFSFVILYVTSDPNLLWFLSFPYFSIDGNPDLRLIWPYDPWIAPFFVNILIKPALPSGSNFADGAVINSIDSTAFDGSWSKIVLIAPWIGFPFNKSEKPVLPLTLISPKEFILTDGNCLMTSLTVLPRALLNISGLYICLSILLIIVDLWVETTTSSKLFPISKLIFPRSIWILSNTLISLIFFVL